MSVTWWLLALVQAAGLAALLARLIGQRRPPLVVPATPPSTGEYRVSVLLPVLNEARRLGPCLRGLAKQSERVSEIIVIDSGSTDGTPELVLAAAESDARIRLIGHEPRPEGWIGKVWALQCGLAECSGDWVLGVDADTEPLAGLVDGLVTRALAESADVVSCSPRFDDMSGAEQFVQVSMLVSLIYRTGSGKGEVLANGQCFMARRSVLLAAGGYSPARYSWSDDVTLARHLASGGARVVFCDGSRALKVRSYSGLSEMWREWGRSFDLTDSTTRSRQMRDVALIMGVQGIPVVLVAAAAALFLTGRPLPLSAGAALAVSSLAIMLRVGMLTALLPNYERKTAGFWLSPLSDPLAALRLVISTVRRPVAWRGRAVHGGGAGGTR
ncbi:MAG: glycosyltransferase family 2 protein [Gemmatimonadota bacterium]